MRYLRADLPGDGLADEYGVEILVLHPIHLLEGGEPHLLHQLRVGVARAQQVASCHHMTLILIVLSGTYQPLVQRPNHNRKYVSKRGSFSAEKLPFQLSIRIRPLG
jgi:hypothetical protein